MKRLFVVFTIGILMMQSCSKNDQQQPNNADTALLKEIVWKDQNASADFTYNTDKTLQSIVYSTLMGKDSVTFSYTANKVSTISSSRSQRKSQYYYNTKGQVSSIVLSGIISPTIYTFDYTYNGAGKVASLKYYVTNEAGKNLIYTCIYDYTSSGDLATIVSTDVNERKLTMHVESYSEECHFNVWPFISTTSVEDMFELYNYPVLSNLKKLPKKIRQITPGYTSIYETDFTINEQKLHKTVSMNYYEDDPQNKVTLEASFLY